MATDIIEAFGQLTRDKALDRGEVIELVKAGMLAAVRRNHGAEADADVLIDPTTGDISIYLLKEVVAEEEDVEDASRQITVQEAKDLPFVNEPWGDGDPTPGEVAEIPLDFRKFGRNAIQAAKQMIIQKVREEERSRIRAEYADRVGELVSGTVQQVDRGNALVFLDRRTEALLPGREQIRREYLRQGETVRALLLDIRETNKGPQLILSRAHPDFVKALFALEVPEVFQGIVEIRAIAREPGSRSKIAVWSRDPHVDPVGACVGLKGSRVQAVVSELGGERIDIVPWTDDSRQFIAQSLSPADVYKIVLHEPEGGVDEGGLFGDPFRAAIMAKPTRFRGPTAAPAPFQPASPEETAVALEASKVAREEAARREAEQGEADEIAVAGPADAEEHAEVEDAVAGEVTDGSTEHAPDDSEAVEVDGAEAADDGSEAQTDEKAPEADEQAPEAVAEPVLEREKRATVVCAEDQLSLAIGRSGQNVRLASKLTGYKIDLVGKHEYLAKEEEVLFGRKPEAAPEEAVMDVDAEDIDLSQLPGISAEIAASLATEGYRTFNDIIDFDREELLAIRGVDEDVATLLMNLIEELTVEIDEDDWEDEIDGGEAGETVDGETEDDEETEQDEEQDEEDRVIETGQPDEDAEEDAVDETTGSEADADEASPAGG